MWIADHWKDYELIDCGGGEKLERWGDKVLVRPDPQAIWNTPRRNPGWKLRDARYARSSTGGGQWERNSLPERWTVGYGGLTFNIKNFFQPKTLRSFCKSRLFTTKNLGNIIVFVDKNNGFFCNCTCYCCTIFFY